jgi:hypothetical protein
MQLEDKYKEYKLNFYRGENKDFPSKLLRDIIEVSFIFLVWYCILNCLLILAFFLGIVGKSCLWFREGKSCEREAC